MASIGAKKVVRDSEWYRSIGKRGGEATKKKYGWKHYSEVGFIGGKAILDKYGKEHYRKIGGFPKSRKVAQDD